MQRTSLAFVMMLSCWASLLFAGDKNNNKPAEMTGWICYSKCVDQSSGSATCNKNCTEGGELVFIDEASGKVSKITNQEMAKPMSGKKCKMKATKDPNTGALAPQNIVEYGGGG